MSFFRKCRFVSASVVIAVLSAISVYVFFKWVFGQYVEIAVGGKYPLALQAQGEMDKHLARLGQLGDFIGGTLNPVISLLGIVGLLITVVLQHLQLREGQMQIAASTRALNFDAFMRIEELLQRKDTIYARGLLHEMCERRDGIGQQDLKGINAERWTAGEKKIVERVCRSFSFVGSVVQANLFDQRVFLDAWGKTIIQCWERTDTFVTHRRAKEDNGLLWAHYDLLYKAAAGHFGVAMIRPVEFDQSGLAVLMSSNERR